MKRIFKSIALCLAIAGAGLTTVSCDSDTITQILNEVLGNLVNTGQTYTYMGSASIQCSVAGKPEEQYYWYHHYPGLHDEGCKGNRHSFNDDRHPE